MQWLKNIRDFLAVLFEPDIVNDFVDDGRPYEVLPDIRSFMENSVKGDYRLYPLRNGFCSSWGNRIVARNNDGELLWITEGWGRCLAIHPESVIFAAAEGSSLCLFNASTGRPLREPVNIGIYLDFLIWIDKNRLLGTDGKSLYIFNDHAEQIDVIEGAIDDDGFIGGLCPDLHHPDVVTILDVNGHQLVKIDLKLRQVITEKDAAFADQLLYTAGQPWIWATVVNGTTIEEIRVYDAKNLRERFGMVFKGKKGVRFANQAPNDISFNNFVSLPSLSPLRQYFLVNDNSGLLWLIDARTGDKRRVFRRNLLDFVLHTHWLDEEHFVAMLDGGFVAKMSVRGTKLIWKENDFLLK